MKLVVIYGPLAVGKFTLGKELQKLTGYKLFHNHLTFDLIGSLFDVDADVFFGLNNRVRLDLIEAAAKHKIKGVIMTFCMPIPRITGLSGRSSSGWRSMAGASAGCSSPVNGRNSSRG